MNTRKWSLVFITSVVLVSMLALTFGAALTTAQDDVIQLTLGSWDDENGNRRHLAAIEDFQAEYPNIQVEILPNPGGDWHTRILTLIAAGELPDVYMADSSFVPLYVESGGLTNLRPYIEDPEVGFDPAEVFYPGVYENGFYQGDPYVLAKDYSTVAIYANKALFDAAGIELPEDGWTYDDLLDIAMQLTVDANGNNAASPDFDPDSVVQWGMDHRGDWWRGFQTTIYSFGSHTISEDGTTLDGYFNSPQVIEALTWMRDAVHVYHVAPTTNWIQGLPGGVMPLFLEGNIAMVFGMGPWFLSMLEEQPGFEYAILPMPTGPGGIKEGAVCWAGFGLAPTSENPDAAWLLLRALGTEIGQRHYGEHALSSMPSIMEGKEDHPFWGTFISEAAYLAPLDDLKNPYYLQCVGNPAGQQITQVLFGEEGANIDVAELVNRVMPELQECLDTQGASMADDA
ncbi:MAG TPA: sugar ABC transporter substrate-binding protein [Spirillospora sp.]|nr:sugar ABC transporter substrate-binding protein [Spirillospora sp.]